MRRGKKKKKLQNKTKRTKTRTKLCLQLDPLRTHPPPIYHFPSTVVIFLARPLSSYHYTELCTYIITMYLHMYICTYVHVYVSFTFVVVVGGELVEKSFSYWLTSIAIFLYVFSCFITRDLFRHTFRRQTQCSHYSPPSLCTLLDPMARYYSARFAFRARFFLFFYFIRTRTCLPRSATRSEPFAFYVLLHAREDGEREKECVCFYFLSRALLVSALTSYLL